MIDKFILRIKSELTLLISSSALCAGSKPNLLRAEGGARLQADLASMWREGANCSGGGFEDPRKRISRGMTVVLGFSRDDCGILSLSVPN